MEQVPVLIKGADVTFNFFFALVDRSEFPMVMLPDRYEAVLGCYLV